MKDVSLAPIERSVDADGVQLRGSWLLLARLLWIAVACVFLSYFLFSFVNTFSSDWAQARVGFDFQSFWNVLKLADNLIINVLCPLLWCAIGAFLFRQTLSKGKQTADLIVLFVSLTLITAGLALALPSVLDPE